MNFKIWTRAFGLIFSLTFASLASAKELWVIHTNDLHSHFESSESGSGAGGYAYIKTVIERLRPEAASQGIDTLVFDGGDFSEGSQFFYADEGHESWKLINAMGYDAIVLGNHDWLANPRSIDRPAFDFLAANFQPSSNFPHLKKILRPYAVYERGGNRIGVLGLTSPEAFYRWRNKGSSISSHVKEGLRYSEILHAKTDIIIALTHLGVESDRELAKRVPNIDLIVGSHSHDLTDVIWQKNQKTGQDVPIVQSGKHGAFVGLLKLDVVRGQQLKILSNANIPVSQDKVPADPEMQKLVKEAREALEHDYGSNWLYEVIGYSFIPLTIQKGAIPTPWSQIVADSMMEATHADLALDIPEFNGHDHPAGPITHEMLMHLYPRTFSTKRPFGWNVWTTEIQGALLSLILKATLEDEFAFTLAGVTWKTERVGPKIKVSDIRIGGEKINPLKRYSLAVPEAIGSGAAYFNWYLWASLRNPRDSGIPIWSAMEAQIRKVSPIH